MLFSESVKLFYYLQGASKNGVTPDGMSYIDAAEKQEIKQLLT